jgi:hypothetical protein
MATRRRPRRRSQKQRAGARFFHYSKKNIFELKDVPTSQVGKNIMKPNGFWISEEQAWKEWCNTSGCFNVSDAYVFQVEMRDDANLYVVDSLKSLHSLQSAYYDPKLFSIDWGRLAKDYAGIRFANYEEVKKELGDFPPEYTWFMMVDINSVCIWRPSEAIQSLVTMN